MIDPSCPSPGPDASTHIVRSSSLPTLPAPRAGRLAKFSIMPRRKPIRGMRAMLGLLVFMSEDNSFLH